MKNPDFVNLHGPANAGQLNEVSDNLCPVSKAPQIERKYWQETRAAGKGRFLRRGVLGSLVTGLLILLVLTLRHSYLRTFQITDLLAYLVVLPVFLLGGYLTAVWQWQDFEKKYPEDRLPPWE